MNDSPRTSKRRRLDTSGGKDSNDVVKQRLQRTSRQRSNPAASLNQAENRESVDNSITTPSRGSQLTRRTSRTPGRSSNNASKIAEEADIYDDIEGALPQRSVSPKQSSIPKPTQSAAKYVISNGRLGRSSTTSTEITTPKQSGRRNMARGRAADLDSFKKLTNGYRHVSDPEAEVEDELAAEPLTSEKRTPSRLAASKTRSKSARALRSGAATPRGYASQHLDESRHAHTDVGIIPKRSSIEKGNGIETRRMRAGSGTDDDELRFATPSQSKRRRTTISESEDTQGGRDHTENTIAVKKRRMANRVDHTNNRNEILFPLNNDQTEADSPEVHEASEQDLEVDGNSTLGSVLDPTEPSPFNKPSPASKKKDTTKLLQGHPLSDRELDLLKSIIIERISAKRAVPLIELDNEYQAVYQIIEHTITAGEGNSMLLIGARGSGKTALVNSVLHEVSKVNGEDYHVVRLNGFVHTDDKIALREIWRQLGKEMDIEEDGGLGKNYADTLTTLLALLSHPSEQTGELTDHVAKAVIFVMDEFDLFASHPRQTLLYNLFDIAQSRKAPIAVLGLTTRIDVANSLEKRVKSRFSHRYVHLSLAKTFSSYQEMCKASLIVRADQISIHERSILCPAAKPAKTVKKSTGRDPLSEWNANITSLFASKSFLTNHLAPHFFKTKSISAVLTTFLSSAAALSSTHWSITPALTLSPADSKIALLPHLSTLALSLLIAAARLDIIHDSDTCNLNMAYDEYVTLASKARIQSAAGGLSASGSVSKIWGKEVAKREWEDLVELGLVMPVVTGQAGGFGMVKVDVALEEIGAVVGSDKSIERALERWCRQL